MTYTCVNTPPDDSYSLLNTRYIVGFQVVADSDIVGSKLNGIKFSIKYDSGTTAGTLYCRLYDSTTTIPTPLHTFGSVDISELTSSYATYTFDTPDTVNTLAAGNLIGLEYSSTSGAPTLKIEELRTSDDQGKSFDYNQNGTIEVLSGRCLYYCYDISAGSSSGTLLPPPVAWI